jgi:DNA-binding GntR family transcriptional regulator
VREAPGRPNWRPTPLIFRMARNRTGQDAFERTHAHLHTFRIQIAAQLGRAGPAEHRAVAAAIAERDPGRSRAEMSQHLQASRNACCRSCRWCRGS